MLDEKVVALSSVASSRFPLCGLLSVNTKTRKKEINANLCTNSNEGLPRFTDNYADY